MGKTRFIESSNDGCGGYFRAINCSNQLEMLTDLKSELQPKAASAGECDTRTADAIDVLARFAISDAQATDDLTMVHEADQWEAEAWQMRDEAPRECRVRCPGKKPFSSLCQAKLVLVRQNGEMETW